MNTQHLINVQQFCLLHDISDSFILSLNDYGLVEIILVEEQSYIQPEQLKHIERLMRLHFDLNINMEGLDVIEGLLTKIESMQQELLTARNRLRLYE